MHLERGRSKPREMPSIKRKGKSGGPKNFQNSAVRTPSKANAPSTKVTTGSRTRRKRNNGKRMHCQTTHRGVLSVRLREIGEGF